ncbi:condensation domain-containing protein [Streptomyces sp. NPDC091279]|uniref:condensation domain-containing protein n=1 Tax=Streptomyces sp. NPDC091279 TaxID=3365983 RepID=UPI0038144711
MTRDLGSLLAELESAGVRLWARDGAVHYDGPSTALPTGVLDELRAQRPELLRRLTASAQGVTVVPAGAEHLRMWRSMRTVSRPEVWINSFSAHTGARIDVDVLRAAMDDVVARHESLRAGFAEGEDGGLGMSVHPSASARVEILDADPAELSNEQGIHARCLRFAGEPLDLTRPPLLRLGVLRHERDGRADDVLALAFHHLIADGVTLEILGDELGARYRARLKGEPGELPPAQPYSGFLEQERRWIETELDEAVETRAAHLGTACAVLTFPEDPDADPESTDNVSFLTLDDADSALFTEAVRRARLSEFAVMLAALNVLMTEVTGASDYVLAVSAACRVPEFAETVGLVRRHVPVRLRALAGDSWADLARRALDDLGEAMAYPLLSLEALRERWAPGGAADFPQLVVTHLPEMRLGVDLGDGLVLWEECPLPGARAGIGMIMRKDAGRVSGGFEIAGALASARTRQRWLDRYGALLVEAARDLDAPLPPHPRAAGPAPLSTAGGTR